MERMLGDLLKGLEMMLRALGSENSADKKREKLAQELFRIHLDLVELVERGRELIRLAGEGEVRNRGISITLLTEQGRVLQSLAERLSSQTLAGVLELHMPDLTQQLFVFLSEKGDRVWFSLDQLVSDGRKLSPEEWVARLEQRMEESGEHYFQHSLAWGEAVRIGDVSALTDPLEGSGHHPWRRRFGGPPPGKVETIVLASPGEIHRGSALLDNIAQADEQLRGFLVQKFKLEDVL
jgi:hypothetical protein